MVRHGSRGHAGDRAVGGLPWWSIVEPASRAPRFLRLPPGQGHSARVQCEFRSPERGRRRRGQGPSGKSRPIPFRDETRPVLTTFYRFACAILVILIIFDELISGSSRATANSESENIVPASRMDSPAELAIRIKKFVLHRNLEDLPRLVSDPDCTLALAGGWERVRRTFPQAKQQNAVNVNGRAISRFLGLIEGRLRVIIPESWEASAMSATGYGQNTIGFTLSEPMWEILKKQKPLRSDDHWILEKDGQTIKLPAEDGHGLIRNFSLLIDGETTYVALYGWPATPYSLFAIERGSNKILWSSKAWATGGLKGYQGLGSHFVEMRSTDETLIIFGCSDDCIYVEMFDKKTGKNRCRFSTSYFDAVAQ